MKSFGESPRFDRGRSVGGEGDDKTAMETAVMDTKRRDVPAEAVDAGAHRPKQPAEAGGSVKKEVDRIESRYVFILCSLTVCPYELCVFHQAGFIDKPEQIETRTQSFRRGGRRVEDQGAVGAGVRGSRDARARRRRRRRHHRPETFTQLCRREFFIP